MKELNLLHFDNTCLPDYAYMDVDEYCYPGILSSEEVYDRDLQETINLYHYLFLPDNRGFQKRPVHKPFLSRNLSYQNCSKSDKQYESVQQNGGALNSPSSGSTISYSLPTSVHFKSLRSNLYYGKSPARIHCFHLSEIDHQMMSMKVIPSAFFDMTINEKVSHVSIDLPNDAEITYQETRHRSFFLIIRAVFRYENTRVSEKINLRKEPLRVSNSRRTSDANSSKSGVRDEIMFGFRKILSYSPDHGFDVFHGDSSISLFSLEELGIENNNNKWMRDVIKPPDVSQLFDRIERFQRKMMNNTFIFITVRNQQDEKDDDEFSDATSTAQSSASSWLRNGSEGPLDGDNHHNLPSTFILEFLGLESTQTVYTVKTEKHVLDSPDFSNQNHSSEHQNASSSSYIDRPATNRQQNQNNNRLQLHHQTQKQHQLYNSVGSNSSENGRPVGYSRVLCSSSRCYFCREYFRYPTINTLLFHMRFFHPRFTFSHKSRSYSHLPIIAVNLNGRFDSSFEMNPMRHYMKALNPLNRIKSTLIDPVWVATKGLARRMRKYALENGGVYPTESSIYNASVFRCVSFADNNINNKTSETASRRATILNRPWLNEAASRKLNEITDIHPSEKRFMDLWNVFVLEVRLTLCGRTMTNKALEMFVEQNADKIRDEGLQMNLLLHLTTLLNMGCINLKDRAHIFLKLDPDWKEEIIFDATKSPSSATRNPLKRMHSKTRSPLRPRGLLHSSIKTRSKAIRKLRLRAPHNLQSLIH